MSMFGGQLPPPGSRALLLGRYSDSHQNPLSADDQIKVLREHCERHGWSVEGVFKDEAKSGRSILKRKGYLDMMAAAEAGAADVICVFHLDRLGRNAQELHDARNRLRDVKAVIYTSDRGVMGRMEFAIYAEMAQMESEKIGERTSRGRLAEVQRGRIMGDIPYGYRWVDEIGPDGEPLLNRRGKKIRRVEVDPVASKVVLRVNLDFDAGKSPHQIAVALTAEGVPTPQGANQWHPNTIIGAKRSQSGLLRNPMIIGKVVHGKVRTELDERTGQVKKYKGEIADQVIHEMPWLRIVPQDVWDRNQERLAKRPPSKLQDRRRPTYLLSGLVKCGVCGGSFVQVAAKMGCSARHVKACSNERRVRREDLERAVLEGMVERLTKPDIVRWFIPEYERERGKAKSEGQDRYDRMMQRLVDVDHTIGQLMEQILSGPGEHARRYLNDQLGTFVAEQERLARAKRAGPPSAPKQLTADWLTERLGGLLRNLGAALQGDERDATRARDILRSLITRVTVTPFDPDGRPDQRRVGGVRVQIEGEVSRLVDQATLDRKIMHKRGAEDVHDLPVATFRFTVDLDRPLSPEQEGVRRDAALIGRMLDDADRPVLFKEMIAALHDAGDDATEAELALVEDRARIGLAQFKREKWVRSVRLGRHVRGWVWEHRAVSDVEWCRRYERHQASVEAGGFTSPIGRTRMIPPDGNVVIIGPSS